MGQLEENVEPQTYLLVWERCGNRWAFTDHRGVNPEIVTSHLRVCRDCLAPPVTYGRAVYLDIEDEPTYDEGDPDALRWDAPYLGSLPD